MLIPALNEAGLLPPGIHDATLDDVAREFGQQPPVRRNLMDQLRRYVDDVKRWQLGMTLLIDGSFVTNKPNPNDIDLILVLREDYDPTRPAPPIEYNLRSNKKVRREYGLDVFAVLADSTKYHGFVKHFSQLRDSPEIIKGIVRVAL